MRVLIAGGGTGGHLMPALALAEALVQVDPAVEPVLVGALRGIEASVLPTRLYRYHLLPLEPIYRRKWWKNLRWLGLAWRVLRECRRVLRDEGPDLAVGTGGYVSGPVLFQAHRMGIPMAVLEQNAIPGLTTRWLARRARQVHLGFPEAGAYLRPGPITAVHSLGNPILAPPDPRPDREIGRVALGIDAGAQVVLVMGGSQGSLAINEAVAALVASGSLDDVVLLWSTGRLTWERYRSYDAPPARMVRAFWDPIADAYAVSDLVVARAGAMTTAELCAWGLPSLLVPLPTAAAGHQQWNAQALAAAGAALQLPEADLSPDSLGSLLRRLLDHPEEMVRMGQSAEARSHPKAARDTASHLLAIVS